MDAWTKSTGDISIEQIFSMCTKTNVYFEYDTLKKNTS